MCVRAIRAVPHVRCLYMCVCCTVCDGSVLQCSGAFLGSCSCSGDCSCTLNMAVLSKSLRACSLHPYHMDCDVMSILTLKRSRFGRWSSDLKSYSIFARRWSTIRIARASMTHRVAASSRGHSHHPYAPSSRPCTTIRTIHTILCVFALPPSKKLHKAIVLAPGTCRTISGPLPHHPEQNMRRYLAHQYADVQPVQAIVLARWQCDATHCTCDLQAAPRARNKYGAAVLVGASIRDDYRQFAKTTTALHRHPQRAADYHYKHGPWLKVSTVGASTFF
jgi:hypothetical protein